MILQVQTLGSSFRPRCEPNPPPLVPVERIRSGLNICPDRLNGGYLLQLDEKTILKVGLRVHMGESEAMILVRNQTSVPVPKVFNAYMIEDIGFILMEKIGAMQLGRNWSKLPREMKESLAQELRGYIQPWRQINGSFFGTVNNDPCQEIIFQHPWENKVYRYSPSLSVKTSTKGWWRLWRNQSQARDRAGYSLRRRTSRVWNRPRRSQSIYSWRPGHV